MWKEFREFAARGNVMDLAVGIILGASFGKIVTSFVNDILMPPLGLVLGRVDFSSLFITLTGAHYNSLAEARAAGAPTINIGVFINTILDFLIVSFAIFLMVRQLNRLTKKAPAPTPPPTRECPYCLSAIPLKASRCPSCTSQLEPEHGPATA